VRHLTAHPRPSLVRFLHNSAASRTNWRRPRWDALRTAHPGGDGQDPRTLRSARHLAIRRPHKGAVEARTRSRKRRVPSHGLHARIDFPLLLAMAWSPARAIPSHPAAAVPPAAPVCGVSGRSRLAKLEGKPPPPYAARASGGGAFAPVM
jgi:hypothetical protein